MQSILNKNDFGFCKASSFRNCNNCRYRIRCINSVSSYSKPKIIQQNQNLENTNIQTKILFETNLKEKEILLQENSVLKFKIEELENQIKELNNSKNNEKTETTEKPTSIKETNLQPYVSQNLETTQQNNAPLKAKKGIFGTKYVEDNTFKQ